MTEQKQTILFGTGGLSQGRVNISRGPDLFHDDKIERERTFRIRISIVFFFFDFHEMRDISLVTVVTSFTTLQGKKDTLKKIGKLLE